MNSKRNIKTLAVTDPSQRKALASSLRLEILGQFNGMSPLTVAEIAARMGRPATAVYYHVHRLEEVGLLVQAGTRPGPKRDEILYQPVAEEFDLTPIRGDDEHVADAVVSLAAAHRMAVGDLKAALESHEARYEGPDRNLLAFRLHARLTPSQRAQANTLLDELFDIFHVETDQPENSGNEFCSLTVALAPLRGRNDESKP